MSVMKVNKFIEILKRLVNEPTVYYSVAGGDWCKWNGKAYNMDCVCMIKGILWGFNFDKNHAHGGAKYGSNGVYDDGTEQLIARCNEVSTDFNNIIPGELLWMPGHVGVYVGNGKVIEATAGWEGKVLYSNVDSNGRRTRNGYQIYNWKKHGKLPYLEYIEEVKKSVDEVAKDVIAGKYGNYPERKTRLEAEGYNYSEVQGKVNEMLKGNKKSIDDVAKEVIQGKYGNQPERQKKLESEGYNYRKVQNRVNEMLR